MRGMLYVIIYIGEGSKIIIHELMKLERVSRVPKSSVVRNVRN